MASRINIGPEDGPYVAINESSGNLQLEDNSGNVVAEWDETNARWDFANNTLANVDALNSNSVNTGETHLESANVSETEKIVAFAEDSDIDTNFSVTLDGFTIEREQSFELVVEVSGEQSSGSSDIVATVNGIDSGTDYRDRVIDGTNISADTERNSVRLFGQQIRGGRCVFRVYLTNIGFPCFATIEPTVVRESVMVLFNGTLDDVQDTITQIDIFTDNVEKGYAYLKESGKQEPLI